MDGVPYDVKPSAPVEAVVVMESVALIESEAEVGSVTVPSWGLRQPPLTIASTMITVPELLVDVSGDAGDNAEHGVSGRDSKTAGGNGEAGTDASTAMEGDDADRVVLYMSTAAAADSVLVKKGEYGGCILIQYSMTASSNSSPDRSVFLVPQLKPETAGSSCHGTLSRSAIKILAVGGKGGDGGYGGSGSDGARGRSGEVSDTIKQRYRSLPFLPNGEFLRYFHTSNNASFPRRMRAIFPAPAMVEPVGMAGTPATARQAPMVEQEEP
jgi:hypothetical protein